MQDFSHIISTAQDTLHNTITEADLQAFHKHYFQKNGVISELTNTLKTMNDSDKITYGMRIKELRTTLETMYEIHKNALIEIHNNAIIDDTTVDMTATIPAKKGHMHMMSMLENEICELFREMGFMIADGPYLDTEWHNFDALTIPDYHPARDMQDTFWVSKDSTNPYDNYVLRTQTSNVQVRSLLEYGAPLRLICPGRVFRNEATDATHDSEFYQVEGLVVDKDISLTHLKGTLETMLSKLFSTDMHIRLRPGYFPFVEPGLEVDFACTLCQNKGCKTCKYTGWIEFMGAGMVHPDVLKNANIDSNEYRGFAFGFGLTRLCMMRYNIPDIRLLTGIQHYNCMYGISI